MEITQYIIDRMIQQYHAELTEYQRMKRYYDGDHDINYFYRKFPNRANSIVIDNYISKFINEECQYALGNPLSYVSLSGNKDIISAIYRQTFHWKNNHNQEVMKNLEIFGKVYLLNYVDDRGRFCEKIVTPLNGISYQDDNDIVQCFIYFYKPQYEDEQYYDIYFSDGTVETYKSNTLIAEHKTQFNHVPVTVCKLDNISDTIYCKIKRLQDAYNEILSDQCNTIADYRNAYLVVTGVAVDEESEKRLQEHGLLNISSSSASVRWLTKDMPDAYIENMQDRLANAMYEVTNHINGNEKLQSNTSGTALRNRLVFLEQQCNSVVNIVINAVYDRLERLFCWLQLKNLNYDITDVVITPNLYIPQDNSDTINSLVQLGIGTNLSLETALSQIPFVENPLQEMAKIEAEQAAKTEKEAQKEQLLKAINLDKLDDFEGCETE